MWEVFILLYFSYLILGPHWETKIIQCKRPLVVDSLRELGRRSIFISYIALLFTAWFLYKPSMTSFISALILSGSATAGFYLKYGKEEVPMHMLLNAFILYYGREYMNPQLWITFGLVTFYTLTHEKLYIN
jgi:hypothetical protein